VKQTVYVNSHKAIVCEDFGCGSRPSAWVFDVCPDGVVIPTIPDVLGVERLGDLIDELHVKPTKAVLVLV
jgi:hypothetical protein